MAGWLAGWVRWWEHGRDADARRASRNAPKRATRATRRRGGVGPMGYVPTHPVSPSSPNPNSQVAGFCHVYPSSNLHMHAPIPQGGAAAVSCPRMPGIVPPAHSAAAEPRTPGMPSQSARPTVAQATAGNFINCPAMSFMMIRESTKKDFLYRDNSPATLRISHHAHKQFVDLWIWHMYWRSKSLILNSCQVTRRKYLLVLTMRKCSNPDLSWSFKARPFRIF